LQVNVSGLGAELRVQIDACAEAEPAKDIAANVPQIVSVAPLSSRVREIFKVMRSPPDNMLT
jgi:hypothetical protein